MQRVVVLGPGGAGKSTTAREIARRTGLPLVELDALFWSADLSPTSPQQWLRVQHELVARPRWVADGDLGPLDVLPPRLAAADTVLLLDLPLLVCVWRALRRGPEAPAFWFWLLSWRRRSRPGLLAAVARYAPGADVHVLRSARAVRRWLDAVADEPGDAC